MGSAPVDSPTFTGKPAAPTAAQTVNDAQLATTAFANRLQTFYGTCTIAAGTAAKTVTAANIATPGFSRYIGATIAVKFTNANTHASATLNVASTGAAPIYYNGAQIPTHYIRAGGTYLFAWNGAQWDLVGDITQTDSLGTARTINNVPIADLQATINGLPKYLDRDVTINVLAGTITSQILIESFTGPGVLLIQGASAVGSSHNIGYAIIRRNNNRQVTLWGFCATTQNGAAYFVEENMSAILLNFCSATAGVNTTSDNTGVWASGNGSKVVVASSLISNKQIAVYSRFQASVDADTLSGSGNVYGYYAQLGAEIKLYNNGFGAPLAAAVFSVVNLGGLIVKDSGSILGT